MVTNIRVGGHHSVTVLSELVPAMSSLGPAKPASAVVTFPSDFVRSWLMLKVTLEDPWSASPHTPLLWIQGTMSYFATWIRASTFSAPSGIPDLDAEPGNAA